MQSPRPNSTLALPPAQEVSGAHSGRRGWIVVAMLFLFILINFGDKAVIGLAATPIREELGLSAGEFGLLASGFYFLFSISALVVGFITTRVSPKWILFSLAIVWTISLVPMAGAVGFTALMISRIALGAGEGPAYPMAVHTAHSWFADSRRNLPTSIITVGSTLGVVVAGPGLTWVIATFNWHAAFVLLGVLSAAWAVAWAFVGKDGPLTVRLKRGGGVVVPAAGHGGSPAAIPEEEKHVFSYWRLFASGTFVGCLVASFATYWSLSVLVAWVPSFMETVLGYTPTQTGTLIILPWLFGAIGLLLQPLVSQRLLNRGISSRWARGFVGGVGVLIAGVAVSVLAWGPGGIVALIALVVGFEFGHMIHVVSMVVLADITPTAQRSAVQGTFLALLTLGGLVGPYVTGLMIDGAGTAAEGFARAFGLLGMLMMVGGVLAMVLIRPERTKARLFARA